MRLEPIPYRATIDYLALFEHDPWTVLLDSADHQSPFESTNRYSYLGFWPFEHLTLHDDHLVQSSGSVPFSGQPFQAIKRLFSRYQCQHDTTIAPFQGGLLGYLSYDLCHTLDHIPRPHGAAIDTPLFALGWYDTVLIFDHHRQRAYFSATGIPDQTKAKRLAQAEQKWQAFQARCQQLTPMTTVTHKAWLRTPLTANFTKAGYCDAVSRVKAAILRGDLFEANISQRFTGTLHDNTDHFALYQRLRQLNPAPFSAYMNTPTLTLLSSSPERFMSLIGQTLQTRPIKGTAKRLADPKADQRVRHALQQSRKDHAENTMIVDLMRNDFSKVCTPNSVQVTRLCQLESFASVHHLVSVVEGQLSDEHDAFDLLLACFPGGSITGAPKIAAMQCIASIEPTCRGPYCGSMIALDFNGNLDSSILIRTLLIHANRLSMQVGGAVVLDSDPEAEYNETLAKARALFEVLGRDSP